MPVSKQVVSLGTPGELWQRDMSFGQNDVRRTVAFPKDDFFIYILQN